MMMSSKNWSSRLLAMLFVAVLLPIYATEESLPEAAAVVTGEGVAMSTSGDAPWFLQTDTSHSSPSAMQSGAIDHDGVTTMTARVEGTGTLSFYWKVSSEQGYDMLSFSVDGVQQAQISGETEWSQMGCYLEEGEHILSWTYAKDYSESRNADCGWVDDIVWPDEYYVGPYSVAVDGIKYYIADGEATVTGLTEGFEDITDLEIPAEVEGVPVTAIGDNAFSECASLATVTLPETIATIGECAFYECAALQSINLPEGLTTIKQLAFCNCSALSDIEFPGTLATLANFAFGFCHGLTSVELPEGLVNLGTYAFRYCTGLTEVAIPSTVTTIGQGAFGGCSSLESIVLAEGNTAFIVQDGVLYDMAMTSLIAYPPTKMDTTFTVPDTVTEIMADAFLDCRNLVKVNLSETISRIHGVAFAGCTGLEEFTIPDSVSLIDMETFLECSSLESIVVGLGVTEIFDTSVFGGCTSLTAVYTDNEYVAEWFATNMPDVEVLPISEPGDDDDDDDDQPLPEAAAIVTGEGVAMFTSGDAPWFLQTDTFHSSPSAMRSGAIDHDGVTMMTAYIDGAGTLSFYWRVSSEQDYDMLSFSVDGVQQAQISGETEWSQMGCYLEEGKHILSWTYAKDYSESDNADCGWVDDIVWPDEHYVGPYSVVADGIIYYVSGGTATVTGVEDGEIASAVILSAVDGASVTAIGDRAFEDCRSLASVTLPEGVTDIGYGAFRNCRSLMEVALPNSLESIQEETFKDCSTLNSIVVPDGVTAIGSFAFATVRVLYYDCLEDKYYYCSSLYGITIGNGVEYIADDAFGDVKPELNFPELYYVQTDNEYVRDWFAERYPQVNVIGMEDELPELPYRTTVDGLVYLIKDGEAMVTGVEDDEITSAVIISEVDGAPVTAIGNEAFEDCSSLVSVTLPERVKSIGDYAFGCCYGLREVTLPEGLEAIGNGAFEDCSSLVSVTLPEGLESIGDYAFEYCESLAAIVIPSSSVTTIGDSAFYDCVSLASVTLPEGLESIGDYAFKYCESLATIVIPSSVTAIGTGCFSECTSLTAIVVAAGNAEYTAVDGVLYSADRTALFCYPEGKPEASFTVPATVAYIEGLDAPALEEILVEDGSEFYASRDGVLYDADFTKLICYPAGNPATSFTLPAAVVSISLQALATASLQEILVEDGSGFYASRDGVLYNADLTSLVQYPNARKELVYVVPETVVEIPYWSLGKNTSLVGMVFGNEVEYLEENKTFYYLSYIQTDNEYVREWFRSRYPAVQLFGMDEDTPATKTVNGLVYLLDDTAATVVALLDESVAEVVIEAEVGGVPVTAVSTGAFQARKKLTSVTIPASITKGLSEWQFDGSPKLVAVNVAEGNAAYASRDGVLYTADFTMLLFYPQGRPEAFFAIPDGVTVVGDYAFEYVAALEEIAFPDSVTDMDEDSFSGNEALSRVYTDNEYVAAWFAENLPKVEVLSRRVKLWLTVPLTRGWNLIGIPFMLDEGSLAVLAQYPVLGFDSATQGYSQSSVTFRAGCGVWLFAQTANDELTLSGMPSDEKGVNLVDGWNLVSPLLDANDGQIFTLPEVEDAWCWMSWGSMPVKTGEVVKAGQGYWLKSDHAQTIWTK